MILFKIVYHLLNITLVISVTHSESRKSLQVSYTHPARFDLNKLPKEESLRHGDQGFQTWDNKRERAIKRFERKGLDYDQAKRLADQYVLERRKKISIVGKRYRNEQKEKGIKRLKKQYIKRPEGFQSNENKIRSKMKTLLKNDLDLKETKARELAEEALKKERIKEGQRLKERRAHLRNLKGQKIIKNPGKFTIEVRKRRKMEYLLHQNDNNINTPEQAEIAVNQSFEEEKRKDRMKKQASRQAKKAKLLENNNEINQI